MTTDITAVISSYHLLNIAVMPVSTHAVWFSKCVKKVQVTCVGGAGPTIKFVSQCRAKAMLLGTIAVARHVSNATPTSRKVQGLENMSAIPIDLSRNINIIMKNKVKEASLFQRMYWLLLSEFQID